MRMTTTLLIVLVALKKELPDLRTEIYGRELYRLLEGKLESGTLYHPILHRLQDEGWLESRRDNTDLNIPPTRPYKWTRKGYDKVREPKLMARMAPYARS